MPAATVARLRNVGRRAWAFLAVVAGPLIAQPLTGPGSTSVQSVMHLRMMSPPSSLSDEHRIEWYATSEAVRKISVASPHAHGLWLRITCDDPHVPSWWFVPLDSIIAADIHKGLWSRRGSLGLTVDEPQTAPPAGWMPIVITLTEG
jgi:hypothetical protein